MGTSAICNKPQHLTAAAGWPAKWNTEDILSDGGRKRRQKAEAFENSRERWVPPGTQILPTSITSTFNLYNTEPILDIQFKT